MELNIKAWDIDFLKDTLQEYELLLSQAGQWQFIPRDHFSLYERLSNIGSKRFISIPKRELAYLRKILFQLFIQNLKNDPQNIHKLRYSFYKDIGFFMHTNEDSIVEIERLLK